MYAVEVKDLVKNYGTFQAVKGISFHVKEGEVFGLIGPNGAGKTTTLRILATLLEVTGGSITIQGIDLREKAGRGPSGHQLSAGGRRCLQTPEGAGVPEVHRPVLR